MLANYKLIFAIASSVILATEIFASGGICISFTSESCLSSSAFESPEDEAEVDSALDNDDFGDNEDFGSDFGEESDFGGDSDFDNDFGEESNFEEGSDFDNDFGEESDFEEGSDFGEESSFREGEEDLGGRRICFFSDDVGE